MGVVNVTPDSFSDGGRFLEPQRAIEHARQPGLNGSRQRGDSWRGIVRRHVFDVFGRAIVLVRSIFFCSWMIP